MPNCTFIRDGKLCGAPSFQDPCAGCIGWCRTMLESGRATGTIPVPVSVNARPSQEPQAPYPPANGVAYAQAPVPQQIQAPAAPVPQQIRATLMDFQHYRNIRSAFIYLQNKSIQQASFIAQEWETLENAINHLAYHGLGEYAPLASPPPAPTIEPVISPAAAAVSPLPTDIMSPIVRPGEIPQGR